MKWLVAYLLFFRVVSWADETIVHLQFQEQTTPTTANSWNEPGSETFNSRVQRGDETKAHSFSGPVVLVFEATQDSVPHILQGHSKQDGHEEQSVDPAHHTQRERLVIQPTIILMIYQSFCLLNVRKWRKKPSHFL